MASNRVKANNLARRRGSAFEYRVAKELKELGSYVYKGTNGDVATSEYIVECKYRMNYHGLGELSSFLEQAKRNADWWKKQGDPKQWLLVTTGGRRSGINVTMSAETFMQLWKAAHEHPRRD